MCTPQLWQSLKRLLEALQRSSAPLPTNRNVNEGNNTVDVMQPLALDEPLPGPGGRFEEEEAVSTSIHQARHPAHMVVTRKPRATKSCKYTFCGNTKCIGRYGVARYCKEYKRRNPNDPKT